MEKYFEVLKTVSLFRGIAPDELGSMLSCLEARNGDYKKGAYLLEQGQKPESIGIVLYGQLHVVKDDVDGNRMLLTSLTEAGIFAEALCCAGVESSPVSVIASVDSTVMSLKFARILHTCPNSCQFHQRLIANMLQLLAQKNLYMQGRMELVSNRSVRAKVLGYLGSFATQRGQSFNIPLNREEMADYLCVERSALSHELMRMKREGLIDYRKNIFSLL